MFLFKKSTYFNNDSFYLPRIPKLPILMLWTKQTFVLKSNRWSRVILVVILKTKLLLYKRIWNSSGYAVCCIVRFLWYTIIVLFVELNFLLFVAVKVKAKVNKLNYTAEYPTLTTLTSDLNSEIKSTVRDKVSQTGCVKTGRCTMLEITVYTSATEDNVRKKRTTTAVMFTIELSCDILAGIIVVITMIILQWKHFQSYIVCI